MSKSSNTLTEIGCLARKTTPIKLNERLNQVVCLCACIHVPVPPGGLSKIGSDPMKVVNDAIEESSNMISLIFRFAANLIAPEEDEGTVTPHIEKQTVHPIKLQRAISETCRICKKLDNTMITVHLINL